MRTLSYIKKDIDFNKNLAALIETLKTIAVTQYRSLEKNIKTFKDFFLAIDSFFEFIDIKRVQHPFLKPVGEAQIIVAVTSDAGFLGGLNIQVVNAAVSEFKKTSAKLIVIGDRGKMYIRGMGIPATYFPGINDVNRHGQAMQVRDYVVREFLSNSFGYLKVIYPKPVSFTVQRGSMVCLLPYNIQKTEQAKIPGIIMESSEEKSLEYLIYLWTGQMLYDVFGASRLAEFAARYVHLEESVQKLEKLEKKIKLEYFHVKHELVDRTMRELFAGRMLYGK